MEEATQVVTADQVLRVASENCEADLVGATSIVLRAVSPSEWMGRIYFARDEEYVPCHVSIDE